jgi:hypothetical protein
VQSVVQDPADAKELVERREWVLEHRLHAAPVHAPVDSRAQSRDIGAVE